MKSSAVFATLLFAVATYSADTLSASDDYYTAYSIETVAGEMPIRNVVVKRVGETFTSYSGFQFDCTTQKYVQTGFYSSPESALVELAETKAAGNYIYSSLSNSARMKACGLEPGLNVSDTNQPPNAS